MALILTNCRIFTGSIILQGQALQIEDGKIVKLMAQSDISADDNAIDLHGHLLAPGFIDTQVNGGAGVLFNNSPTSNAIKTIGEAHRTFGTTGYLPTLISDDFETMQLAIDATKQALADKIPGLLGVHLEGPFLNTARKGVHPEEKLRNPNSDSLQLLKQVAQLGTSMVTLAPEVVPEGFIKSLCEAGVVVSMGHSDASYDCVIQAVEDGASGITHLFNAMSPLTSREPGVVGAALDDPHSWCGIIVDGHHVHPATLKTAIRAKAKGKMILVSDAVQTVGAAGVEFDLAGQSVFRKNGKVTTADGTLAGSDLDMASAVRNTVQMLGIEIEEALRMASLYPAQFLSLDHQLGRIAENYRADLVLLDDDFQVVETWISGEACATL